MLVWKPEGLDLSAGPVPVFPIIIYIIYRDKRIAAPKTGTLHANLAVPKSTSFVFCALALQKGGVLG